MYSKTLYTTLLLLATCGLAPAQSHPECDGQPDEQACNAKRNGDKPEQKTDLSADFSKLAIKALVAVRNQTLDGSDQPVKAAINDADVEASSKAEQLTVNRIKTLSGLLRIQEQLHDQAIALAPNALIDKTQAQIDHTHSCIDALRLTVKSHDGAKPKECNYIVN
jgi:hypothetical protein